MTMPFDDDNRVTVYKLDERGEEVWKYDADVVAKGANFVCVRAPWIGRQDELHRGFLVFRRGDMMTEWHYNDRWFNIFRLQDGSRGALKGFYCNITRPAKISEEVVTAEDIALDVLVSPLGNVLLDDEDEFQAMPLSDEDRAQALNAVEEIKQMVANRAAPFDELT
jgi:uncharacterized protein